MVAIAVFGDNMHRLFPIGLMLIILLYFSATANAVVVTFDNLSGGTVPKGYADITWGTSTLSKPDADSTFFQVSSRIDYSSPHSSPNFVLNGYGVPDLWFQFAYPVNFHGAWLAAPKANPLAAQKVRFVDDTGHMSDWLQLSETPQYLSAEFSSSKIVYVQPRGVFGGVESNGGWYTLDDITYSTMASMKQGDCDGNGQVSIAEVQSSINMFLRLKTVAICVDREDTGAVTIADVARVINRFLGL